MAEQLTHINYSFEDIQRYLKGEMSAAEMHDVEKAALQDPFLADAIEGYSEVPGSAATHHLNEINAALSGEKKNVKIVAFNRKAKLLRIAALVIVLAGVGIVGSYIFNKSPLKQNVAQLKRETNQKNTVPVTVDSLKNYKESKVEVLQNGITNNANQPGKKEKSAAAKKQALNPAIETYGNAEADKADVTAMLAAPVQHNANDSVSFTPVIIEKSLQGKVNGLTITPNKFFGKVVDENNAPVPFATVQLDNKKQALATDATGNFIIPNNSDTLNVTVSAIGYTSKAANLETGNKNVIRLRGVSSALNDVVVTTALGVNKKAKPVSDSAKPVGGWENFNSYVLSQLNEDSTSQNDMSEKDMVELEFLIDNAGNPYNIKITKPLDEQHNSKAIDILKSGPKWTNTSKKKKAKVAISF